MNEFDGVQGRPHQDVPLWHVGYFELKTIKAHKTRRNCDLPPNCVKNLGGRPVTGIALLSAMNRS